MQIYKEPICKRHYIPILSFTFLFRAFGYAACIFLAAVVSHAAGDTWTKHKVSSGQPDVHFQYRALAQFTVRSAGMHMSVRFIPSLSMRTQVPGSAGWSSDGGSHSLHDRHSH